MGLYWIGDRWYDPDIGQFVSPCNIQDLVYNIFDVGNYNRYSLGICHLYFPPSGFNLFPWLPLVAEEWKDPRKPWQINFSNWYGGLHWGWKVGIGAGIIVIGAAATFVSGGLLAPVGVGFMKAGATALAGYSIAAGAGFVIGGGFNALTQIGSGGWSWESFVLSAVGGAVAASIASLAPVAWGIPGQFAFGGFGAVAGGVLDGGVNSWETMLFAFMIGGLANVAANGMSGSLKLNMSRTAVGSNLLRLLIKPTMRAIIGYAFLEEYMSWMFENGIDYLKGLIG